MEALGARLGRAAVGGAVFLSGELGSGKTTLVRGILRSQGHRAAVRSPSYTLIEAYELPSRRVYHFDLYRIADPQELEALGVRDYFDGKSLCLVEWPERAAGRLWQPDVEIRIEYAGTARKVRLEAKTAIGCELSRGIG
jgi:tRNA threonylcarbamoyladenosine biosynthesis protein TsaE